VSLVGYYCKNKEPLGLVSNFETNGEYIVTEPRYRLGVWCRPRNPYSRYTES